MKTKKFFITPMRICIALSLVCNICLQAEIPAEKTNFSIMQSIDNRSNYFLKAEAKNGIFHIYAEAKNKENKFSLTPQGFNLKFSPLFYMKKKNPQPALSFFYGGIKKTSLINKENFIKNFEKRPFYKGFSFIPSHLIDISKTKFGTSFGTEFSIKNFNLVFLSEEGKNKKSPDFSFCAVYKTETENKIFNLMFFSSLINSAYSQFNKKKPNYDQFYLGEFRSKISGEFTSSAFLLAGGLNLPYEKLSNLKKNFSISKLLFFSKVEYNFQSEYFILNTGALYNKKENLQTFIQPKISIWLLDIEGVYNFTQKYSKKIQKFHSGGIGIDLNLPHFKFTSETYYKNDTWDLKKQVKIPIFLKTVFLIKGNCTLEDKSKNPFIVKEYSISSDLKIKFNKNINLNFSGNLKQRNKIKKIKKIPHVFWEKKVFTFSLDGEFKKKTRHTLNSFKGEITLETIKPFISGSLSYTIKF